MSNTDTSGNEKHSFWDEGEAEAWQEGELNHWTEVLRDDTYYEGLRAYLLGETNREISAWLKSSEYTIKETSLTYRTANHWVKEGLLDDTRPGGKGWHRFSLLDMVWFQIAADLRELGFSLEKLRTAKAFIERPTLRLEDGSDSVTLFEYHIALALFNKEPAYILVFHDGRMEPVSLEQLEANLCFIRRTYYVVIYLNPILQRLMTGLPLDPKIEDGDVKVTSDEAQLLSLIRSGSYEQIRIRLRDGAIKVLEAEERLSTERIVDILNDSDFQDVEIKRRDGKNVVIRRTLLTKL